MWNIKLAHVEYNDFRLLILGHQSTAVSKLALLVDEQKHRVLSCGNLTKENELCCDTV